MVPGNHDEQARGRHIDEKKLGEQLTEFIDLTDEEMEEVDVSEVGIHGGQYSGDYSDD